VMVVTLIWILLVFHPTGKWYSSSAWHTEAECLAEAKTMAKTDHTVCDEVPLWTNKP